MPLPSDKIPKQPTMGAAPAGKYKGNPGLLMGDLNERLRVALEDGIDPWGQGLSFAQILQEIKLANEYKHLLVTEEV